MLITNNIVSTYSHIDWITWHEQYCINLFTHRYDMNNIISAYSHIDWITWLEIGGISREVRVLKIGQYAQKLCLGKIKFSTAYWTYLLLLTVCLSAVGVIHCCVCHVTEFTKRPTGLRQKTETQCSTGSKSFSLEEDSFAVKEKTWHQKKEWVFIMHEPTISK